MIRALEDAELPGLGALAENEHKDRSPSLSFFVFLG
jgi:hypothetical protein